MQTPSHKITFPILKLSRYGTCEPIAADVEERAVLGGDHLDGVDAELVVDDHHLLHLLHLDGARVDVGEQGVQDLQLPGATLKGTVTRDFHRLIGRALWSVLFS